MAKAISLQLKGPAWCRVRLLCGSPASYYTGSDNISGESEPAIHAREIFYRSHV